MFLAAPLLHHFEFQVDGIGRKTDVAQLDTFQHALQLLEAVGEDVEALIAGRDLYAARNLLVEVSHHARDDERCRCVAVVAQAEEYGHSVEREYAFLIAHSMLHLFGYDHMEDDERKVMEDKQKDILERLQIYR